MPKEYWIHVYSSTPYKSDFNGILPSLPGVVNAVVYENFELPIYFKVQFESTPILDAHGCFVQNNFHLTPAHELDDIHPCVKGGGL